VAAGPHAVHQVPPARRRAGSRPTAPDAAAASSRYTFDPRDPVPTIGGNISSGDDILLQGAWDQRGGKHVWNFPNAVPLSARNDVLVFQTDPLPADVEVTGEIEVKLWVSSSAVDTDFTAKLVDVYPPGKDWPGGFDLNVGDGILRARFRDSLKGEKLMEPGRSTRSRSSSTRRRTCSSGGTGSGWTCRAATSPGST
jgi:predicted acyl esterase